METAAALEIRLMSAAPIAESQIAFAFGGSEIFIHLIEALSVDFDIFQNSSGTPFTVLDDPSRTDFASIGVADCAPAGGPLSASQYQVKKLISQFRTVAERRTWQGFPV